MALPISQVKRILATKSSAALQKISEGLDVKFDENFEKQFLRCMLCARLQISAFHQNAAASSCARRQQWQAALALLGMKVRCPNSSAAVNAFKTGGQWRSALALLNSLSANRAEADLTLGTFQRFLRETHTNRFRVTSMVVEYDFLLGFKRSHE